MSGCTTSTSGTVPRMAIGVSTPKRSAALPDVPPLAEVGLPNYSFDAWIALIGPAGLPKPLVDKLYADTKAALATKSVEETLAQQGIAVIGSDPETARKFFQTELDKHTQLVKRSGAKLD